jgi:hypothetical protein
MEKNHSPWVILIFQDIWGHNATQSHKNQDNLL